MAWDFPEIDIFRKIPKQHFLIQIYNRYILGGLGKNRKDTKLWIIFLDDKNVIPMFKKALKI